MNKLRVRVERGAAWLDKVAPGWESKIDHQALDLTDNDACILGQVFGHFAIGIAAGAGGCVSLGNPWTDSPWTSGGRGTAYLHDLTNEWLALLVERNDKTTPARVRNEMKEDAHV